MGQTEPKHRLRFLFSAALMLGYGGGVHPLRAHPDEVVRPVYGDVIMSEKSKPLVALDGKVLPDEGGPQRGLSAAGLLWPTDLPDANHKANSVLARILLLQYAPGGGRDRYSSSEFREQVFYVLAGRAQVTLGGSTREVGPGYVIFVPSKVSCAIMALGGAPLKMLLAEWRNVEPSDHRSFAGTIISEKEQPLRRLTVKDARGHRGISSSPFVTFSDYPTLAIKANSQVAWIGLQQYDPEPSQILNTEIHSHRNWEHAFYILEGKVHFVVGEVERDIGPGELVYVPRYVKHSYKVVGDAPMRWLMMQWSGWDEPKVVGAP